MATDGSRDAAEAAEDSALEVEATGDGTAGLALPSHTPFYPGAYPLVLKEKQVADSDSKRCEVCGLTPENDSLVQVSVSVGKNKSPWLCVECFLYVMAEVRKRIRGAVSRRQA